MICKLAFAALLLAVTAPAAAQSSVSPRQAVIELYAPYATPDPDWASLDEVKIYSDGLDALYLEWDGLRPSDEVTELSDFDWLCECQDWDYQAFRVDILSQRDTGPDAAEVTARVSIGFGEAHTVRLEMVREGGTWLLDDQFSQAFPAGVKAALREEIATLGGE